MQGKITMKSEFYILGIDLGTSELKLSIFDANGHSIGFSRREYPTVYPRPAWAEQNPNDWWSALVHAIKELFKGTEVNSQKIVGIGVSAHLGLIPIDKEGQVLRKAILYTDQRNVFWCDWIKKNIGERLVFKITGNLVAPMFTAPLILWINMNEPRIYGKTHKFLVTPGYIVYRLTGEFTFDWTYASTTLLFETVTGRKWSKKLCTKMKIPIEKLPSVKPSWKVAGGVTPKAAKETGLAEATPVVVGGSDTACAAFGVGLIKAGLALNTVGSCSSIVACLDKPVFSSKLLNRCHVIPDRWLVQGSTNTHGAVLKWFAEEFSYIEKARRLRVSPYELLDEEAKKSEPGANGLIFLPYLMGERAPIWDPHARGVIFGLTLTHKRRDIIRSMLEGTVFAVKHNLEVMEKLGIRTEKILVTGGGSNSRFWRQIRANITGKPIILPSVREASALGAAMIAGLGIGLYKNVKEAIEVIAIEEEIKPERGLCEKYCQFFELYKELYKNLKGTYKELSHFTL